MNIFPVFILILATAGSNTDPSPAPGYHTEEVRSFFDLICTIDVELWAGNGCSVGCGFDGTYLWVTNGAEFAGTSPTGKFLLFEEDGTFVTSFDQNEAPGWGLRDLCCDGLFIFGSLGTSIDYYDISTHQKAGSFIGPEDPNRAMAYRSSDNSFFTGNFGNILYRLTWDGVSGSTASSSIWSTQCVEIYGASWDWRNDCMWVTSCDGSGTITQLDSEGNLIYHHTPVAGGQYGGATMGNTYSPNTLWILLQSSPDQLLAYDVEPDAHLDRNTWGSIKSMF